MKTTKVESKRTALLLIDIINHFEFTNGDQVLRQALRIRDHIAELKTNALRAKIPVLYVNDNFGDWHSEKSALISYCMRPGARGCRFVEKLLPGDQDYFVLKPMHSAFYQSPLEQLLKRLRRDRLILAGLTTDSCIIATAHDANMRDFTLHVPSDCSSARTQAEHRAAIQYLQSTIGANVQPASALRFPK